MISPMNRRLFLASAFTASGSILLLDRSLALAAPSVSPTEPPCTVKQDEISAEATYFSRYEHHHQLAIPVSVLIAPPKEGFTTRTSTLDQGSLDSKALDQFLKESGLSQSLRFHSHEVTFKRRT